MTLRGVEMGIAGDDISSLDEMGEENILGSASLVSRDYIVEAGDALDDVLELIEAACAGIAFVAGHHGSPLAVGHCTGSAVGQTVDVDMVAAEHEYVVFGIFKPFFALFASAFVDRFHHLDLPRFSKRYFHCVFQK